MAPVARSLLVLLISTCTSVRAAGADAEQADDECEVLLLQTSAGLQRQNLVQPAEPEPQPSQAERLEAALPLVYAHVPKTGSSIVNAFVRLPGVCPDLAEQLGEDSYSNGEEHGQFEVFRNYSLCPGLIPPPPPGGYNGNELVGYHRQLGSAENFEEHYAGHAVTILRQPEQRVISGLRHASNDTDSRFSQGCGGRCDIEDLRFSQGCAVRLFVGEDAGFSGTVNDAACFALLPGLPELPEVSSEDVAEAVARLQRFAFVGIQEEWQLSVCLLHAMFGGECSAVEFGNTRPSPMGDEAQELRQGDEQIIFHAPEPYDTSILGGWIDAADRAVYDAGLEMFHARCEEHGVSPETCQPCYQNAGLQ